MSESKITKEVPNGSVHTQNQSGGIAAGNIQATNVAGGNIENVINQDSSIQEVVKLLETMKKEIDQWMFQIKKRIKPNRL